MCGSRILLYYIILLCDGRRRAYTLSYNICFAEAYIAFNNIVIYNKRIAAPSFIVCCMEEDEYNALQGLTYFILRLGA